MKSLILASVCGVVLFSGCASVSVRKVEGTPGKTVHQLPKRIYVKDYEAPAQNLEVDRTGEDLTNFQYDLANQFSEALVGQLDRHLAPAKRLNQSAKPARENAWLLVGKFDRVEQGSRALRSIFGFGLGATKMVATTYVYDLSTPSPSLVMSIQTTGGSNAAPGTVVNLAPLVVLGPAGLAGAAFGTATGVVPGAAAGLESDLKRTAREITAVLSDYCYKRGLIFKEHAMNPKHPGDVQLRMSDPVREQ